MAELKIKGDISGSTTITAPDTGTDETIELSTALASKLDLAGGKILQVSFGSASVEVSTSSTNFADSGLSATITPLFSSSKILIIVSQAISNAVTSSGSYQAEMRILRDSTQLLTSGRSPWFNQSTVTTYSLGVSHSISYLDSPTTTSPIIYKTQIRSTTASNLTVSAQTSGGKSSIILLEVSE